MVPDASTTTRPTLARETGVLTQAQYNNVKGSISGADGIEIANFTGSVTLPNIHYPSSISFKIAPMIMNSIGRYEIKLGLDCPPGIVHSFEVRTKEQLNTADTKA